MGYCKGVETMESMVGLESFEKMGHLRVVGILMSGPSISNTTFYVKSTFYIKSTQVSGSPFIPIIVIGPSLLNTLSGTFWLNQFVRLVHLSGRLLCSCSRTLLVCNLFIPSKINIQVLLLITIYSVITKFLLFQSYIPRTVSLTIYIWSNQLNLTQSN